MYSPTVIFHQKSMIYSLKLVSFSSGEVARLQGHLNLLRAEYVKLQTRLAEVEKKYQVAQAAAGRINSDNYVARLLRTIADLFDKELYR